VVHDIGGRLALETRAGWASATAKAFLYGNQTADDPYHRTVLCLKRDNTGLSAGNVTNALVQRLDGFGHLVL
jgi:hypothetical protein